MNDNMKNYTMLLTFADNTGLRYNNIEEAQKDADELAQGIADLEGLNIVEVKVTLDE